MGKKGSRAYRTSLKHKLYAIGMVKKKLQLQSMKMSIPEIEQERCKVHELERKIQNKNCFNYMIRSITVTSCG